MAEASGYCSSSSNVSSGLQSVEFLTVNIILLIISLVAVGISVSTIIALFLEAAILEIQRILLVNLVVTEILTAATGIVTKVNSIVLISTDGQPSESLCRVTVWSNSVGITARMFGLVAYSVTFLLILKCGKQRMKSWVSILLVAIVWLSAFFVTVDRLIPQAIGVRYLGNVRCWPSVCDGKVIFELRIAFRVFWLIFVGAVPLVTAIVVPAIGYKTSRVSRTTSPHHARTTRRLMMFLIAGTLATLLWMLSLVLWPILSTHYESMHVPAGYVVVTAETLAIIPTSLLILTYLRRTHQLAGKVAKCCTKICSNRYPQSDSEDVERNLSYRRVIQNCTLP